MAVNSRDELVDYCLRKLGSPVIEINVDPDQVSDRIDEGLDKYQEFHSDAIVRIFLKHLVTSTDIANGYITLPNDTIFVKRMFSNGSGFSSGRGMFDIKYQMILNDIAFMNSYVGDLSYFTQMQQYLSLLDTAINGLPLVTFSRNQNRLYIHGDDLGTDIKEGEYIVVEADQIINPETYTSVYDDMWLKKYVTALIKRQWGSNLIKFEGMQLPGGVTLNGRQLYDDAIQEIERLEEELRLTFELPVDFLVG